MRRASTALITALIAAGPATDLAGQDPRLVDRLDAPLAYLAVEPGAIPAGAVAPQDLLVDPALLSWLGVALPERRGATSPLHLLRRVLASGPEPMATGGIELALTGVLPRGTRPALPLLVFRAGLRPSAARAIGAYLATPGVVTGRRRVGDRDVHQLSLSEQEPGAVIEAVLIDSDLIVTNSITSMDEVLAPATDRSSRGRRARDVLATDPTFRDLRSRVAKRAGSLSFYADWGRLARRLASLLRDDAPWFLDWSGLALERKMLVAIRPERDSLVTTVAFHQDEELDGWLAALKPMRARELVARVPAWSLTGGDGAGSFTVTYDSERLLGAVSGSRLHRIHAYVSGGCSRAGVDLQREVLARLDEAGSVSWRVPNTALAAAGGMSSIYSLRARSSSAAQRLFQDVTGKLEKRQACERRGDLALLRGLPTGYGSLVVAPHGHDIVMAGDEKTVDSILNGRKRAGEVRSRRADILASLDRLGASRKPIAGVLSLDLSHHANAGQSSTPLERSLLMGSHVGYLEVRDGTVRLEVISRRGT